MAKDDQVAHFFGGRNDTPPPAAPTVSGETDEFGLPAEPQAETETELDGEIAIDVFETNEAIVIVSPVAGVSPDHINITAGHNAITISGQRQAEHASKKHGLVTQEIYWGSFSRTVQLPDGTSPEEAQASFKHGILTVKVPKSEQAKKKTIKVNSEE